MSQFDLRSLKTLIQDRLATCPPRCSQGARALELSKPEQPPSLLQTPCSSPPARAASDTSASPSETSRMISELKMHDDVFDPSSPLLRLGLLRSLDLSKSANIVALGKNSGSFNEGVWVASDTEGDTLVLKLVPHHRLHPSRKTEAERYMKLRSRVPGVVTDARFAYPLRILVLVGASGLSKDLIVMRRAAGSQITEHMYFKIHTGQVDKLLLIFKDFGRFLHDIHRAYTFDGKSMQHGDCQPSNIFYDEVNGQFTMIDIADLGYGPYVAEGGGNDVEHFVVGLRTLTKWYGEALLDACVREFLEGYGGTEAKP